MSWLLALDVRAQLKPAIKRYAFDAIQLGLGLLTVVALSCLFDAIQNGLLGYPEDTAVTRTAKFQSHLNRDVLPIAWVAHCDGRVFGTAALRVHDLEGREDLTPWLGGVLVEPQFRYRGIGAALCQAVEEKAYALGMLKLYLFTLDKQAWYRSRGWSMAGPCSWRGHPGNIMHKPLHAGQHCAAADRP
ncbi:MAG: GNAT family N-acetyltransferase [Gammaproteobacteria bacterium]